MTTSKLPARPSLESLRKQAKKLARDIAAGDAAAIARARAQLPQAELPLSQRDAQLVLAREYGFPGWKDLLKEVNQRLGKGLEWAVSEARRIIHDNDTRRLRQLLAEYPALLSWRSEMKTTAGCSGWLPVPSATAATHSERSTSRARHVPSSCSMPARSSRHRYAIASSRSRAKGLIDLFHRRGLLPQTLKFFAALGDVDGVRACLDTNADDLAAVNEAFMYACHLQHATAAALLLDRAITLDAEMGRRIDGGPGRSAFIQYFIANKPDVHDREPFRPWQAFVEQQVAQRDAGRRPDILCRRIAARSMAAVGRMREIPGRVDRGNGGRTERSRSFP